MKTNIGNSAWPQALPVELGGAENKKSCSVNFAANKLKQRLKKIPEKLKTSARVIYIWSETTTVIYTNAVNKKKGDFFL